MARAFRGESLVGKPVEASFEEAAALCAEGMRVGRAEVLRALRDDEALVGDICGYIAPEQAASGTIRSILRRAADFLERTDG